MTSHTWMHAFLWATHQCNTRESEFFTSHFCKGKKVSYEFIHELNSFFRARVLLHRIRVETLWIIFIEFDSCNSCLIRARHVKWRQHKVQNVITWGIMHFEILAFGRNSKVATELPTNAAFARNPESLSFLRTFTFLSPSIVECVRSAQDFGLKIHSSVCVCLYSTLMAN